MKKRRLPFVTALAVLIGLMAIVAPRTMWAQTTDADPPFSHEALGNATYLNEYGEDGEVTLEDGFYDREAAPGSASRVQASLTGYVAYGDLDGDEIDEAAVVLVTNGGGTGSFFDLAIMSNEDDGLTNVATTLLGDRVMISDLAIEDGQIVVDMTTQGPDDPLCCPTLDVQQIYALEEGALTLVSEEEAETDLSEGVFSPDADPTAATLYLGGADSFWLDPTLVSVHSGATTGPGVKANTLGQGCAGVIDERPEVVINWAEDETADVLRIFFLSMGDPTMVVVTPDGEVTCNDDLNPLVLDPYLEFEQPLAGRYAVYLGSFEDEVTTPGFLVATSHDLSPATLDVAQMFPRQTSPDAVGEPLPIDVLKMDAEPAVDVPDAPITLEMTPYQQEIVVGGDLGAFEIELDNDLCTGFIDATPSFTFDWEGDAEKLVLFFEADADTTLLVRNPNGDFQCNDDADDANNLNPYLDLTPIDGNYKLWIGSFEPSTLVTGTLTIAGSTDVQPVPLTSEEIE